jgi:hypothetical protein
MFKNLTKGTTEIIRNKRNRSKQLIESEKKRHMQEKKEYSQRRWSRNGNSGTMETR